MTVNHFFISKLLTVFVAIFIAAMIVASKSYFNQQEKSSSTNLFLSMIKIEKQLCCDVIKGHFNTLIADAHQQHHFPVDGMQNIMARYKGAYGEQLSFNDVLISKNIINWQS